MSALSGKNFDSDASDGLAAQLFTTYIILFHGLVPFYLYQFFCLGSPSSCLICSGYWGLPL